LARARIGDGGGFGSPVQTIDHGNGLDQRLRKFRCSLVAACRILGQRLQHDLVDLWRYRAIPFGRARRRLVHVRGHELELAPRLERRAATDHFEQNHSQ